ncbi:hypothetical protein WA158_001646 [Blastocystis sp. Blastoise]
METMLKAPFFCKLGSIFGLFLGVILFFNILIQLELEETLLKNQRKYVDYYNKKILEGAQITFNQSNLQVNVALSNNFFKTATTSSTADSSSSNVNSNLISNNNILSTTGYDVTLISQASESRLLFLQEIIKRWHGPISVAFYSSYTENPDVSIDILKTQAIDTLQKQIDEFHFPSRVYISILAYPDTIYPYNALRNEAISHVTTSHYFVCDMDLFPANNTYEAILSLPQSLLSDEWAAIIVPAYEYKLTGKLCFSFKQCVDMVGPKLPYDIPSLKSCMDDNELCRPFRIRQGVHEYHPDCFFDTDKPKPKYTVLSCFYSVKQEPYVIVKRSSHLPSFDPNFVNYGKDKISWIENLRYIGYKYYVMTETFGIDFPHPKSDFYKKWAKTVRAGGNDAAPASQYYKQFLRDLHKKKSNATVHICSNRDRSIYTKCSLVSQ